MEGQSRGNRFPEPVKKVVANGESSVRGVGSLPSVSVQRSNTASVPGRDNTDSSQTHTVRKIERC